VDFDFSKLLKGAAQGAMAIMPTVATAVGGPFAGMAVSWLGEALLGEGAAQPGAVAAAVQQAMMTPDGVAKLKELDHAFQLRCRELDIDLEKIHAGDRDSARKREAATGDSWTPRLLAALTTGGFFGLIGVMCFVKVPIENRDAIMLAIGALGAGWSAILSYYFGSSRGSAAKDELLGRMAPTRR
jgi:hypothetical protein